jgi:hypothetical protein
MIRFSRVEEEDIIAINAYKSSDMWTKGSTVEELGGVSLHQISSLW